MKAIVALQKVSKVREYCLRVPLSVVIIIILSMQVALGQDLTETIKGNFDSTVSNQLQALRLFQKLKNPLGQVTCYNNLGSLMRYNDKYEESIRYYRLACEVSVENGFIESHIISLCGIGYTKIRQKQYEQAEELFQESLKIAEKNAMPHRIIEICMGLSECYSGLGQFKEALVLAEKSMQLKDSMYNKENATKLSSFGELTRNYIIIVSSTIILFFIGVVIFNLNQKIRNTQILIKQKEQLDLREKSAMEADLAERELRVGIKSDHMNLLINEFERLKSNENIKRLALPTTNEIVLLNLDEIVYCEGDSNYTNVYLVDKSKLVLAKTLKLLEQFLPEEYYFRIHNTHIININHIVKIIRKDNGYVLLDNGKELAISRSRKDEFYKKLNLLRDAPGVNKS